MNKNMVVVCGKSIEEVIAQVDIIKAARAMGATVGVGGSMEEVEAMLSSATEGCKCECTCECECEWDEDEILEEVLGHDVAQLALRMTELDGGGLEVIESLISALERA